MGLEFNLTVYRCPELLHIVKEHLCPNVLSRGLFKGMYVREVLEDMRPSGLKLTDEWIAHRPCHHFTPSESLYRFLENMPEATLATYFPLNAQAVFYAENHRPTWSDSEETLSGIENNH